MDKETIHLYNSYKALDESIFKTMSIEELFDLRHDMMGLLSRLEELLKEATGS